VYSAGAIINTCLGLREKNMLQNFRISSTLIAATVAALGSTAARADLEGSADIQSTRLVGGSYRYLISIHNTGSTNIGTFWFAWTPDFDFLVSPPTNIVSPSGWIGYALHGPTGYSIEWNASLARGQPIEDTEGFGFDSADSPDVLRTLVHRYYQVSTSFFYIDAPFADPGFEFVAAVHDLCMSDLNADFLVDDSDFVVFANSYDLLDCADPSMPSGCPSDINLDGFVDDSDFVLFAQAYDALLCP